MAQLDVLLPRLQLRVPAAPNALMKAEAQEAVRNFCFRTEAYETEYAIASVADQAAYDVEAEISAGEHVNVYRLITAWPEDWNAPIPNTTLTMDDSGVVTLDNPLTESSVDITFKCVMIPTRTWTAINAEFFAQHFDAFIAKALWGLYMLPYGWHSSALAMENKDEYLRLCGKSKGDRLKQRLNTQLRASPRRFE